MEIWRKRRLQPIPATEEGDMQACRRDGLGTRRGGPAIVAVATALLVTGCETMQNTPQQDYVWDMGRRCDSTTLRMSRVEADGRYTVQGASNVVDFTPYRKCMEEQFQRQPYSEWVKANRK